MSNKALYSMAFATATILATVSAGDVDAFGEALNASTGLNHSSKSALYCGYSACLDEIEEGCDVTNLIESGVLKPCFKNLFGDKGDNCLQDFVTHPFSLDSISDTGFGVGCQFECKPGETDAVPTGIVSRSVFCVEYNARKDKYIVGCDGLKGNFLEAVAKMKNKLFDKLEDIQMAKCKSFGARCGEPTVLCPTEGLSPEPGDIIPTWFSWHLFPRPAFLPRGQCDEPLCNDQDGFFCEEGEIFVPNRQVCTREITFSPHLIPKHVTMGYWISEPEECDRCSPGIEPFPIEECSEFLEENEAKCVDGEVIITPKPLPGAPGNGGGNGSCGSCCKSQVQNIAIDEITATEDAIITINGGGASRPCDNNKPHNPIGSIIDHLNEIHDIKKDIKDSIL